MNAVSEFKSKFHIIPSITNLKQLSYALTLDNEYILLSETHIGNLKSLVDLCHKSNKKVIVNMDLIGGLATDTVGIKLLKQKFKVNGAIARGTSKINLANNAGLTTIQHIILEDSLSLNASLNFVERTKASMVELRPAYHGLKYIERFKEVRNTRYLLSGFIDNENLIYKAKAAGVYGITTSSKELWNLL